MTKTPKRSLREKLHRINALAAPDGWDRDVNFGLPAWRYWLVGALIGGVFLAIASLDGALTATDWILPLLMALPLWLIPPLRARYLRTHPRPTEPSNEQ